MIDLVRSLPMIPERFFKHLEGTVGLFEIRIKVRNNIFRVFCFLDKGNMEILLNGFQKRSQKTPKIELKKLHGLLGRITPLEKWNADKHLILMNKLTA